MCENMCGKPKRKNNRLKQSLYDNGDYFVTVVTKGREHLFSEIERDGSLHLTEYGKIAEKSLQTLPEHFPKVEIMSSVVMPDHVHMIVRIRPPGPSLYTVIGAWKAGISRRLGRPVWQRSYYDHVIRNEQDYNDICKYIETNPLRWAMKRNGG